MMVIVNARGNIKKKEKLIFHSFLQKRIAPSGCSNIFLGVKESKTTDSLFSNRQTEKQ
jgi:hypothetical protein